MWIGAPHAGHFPGSCASIGFDFHRGTPCRHLSGRERHRNEKRWRRLGELDDAIMSQPPVAIVSSLETLAVARGEVLWELLGSCETLPFWWFLGLDLGVDGVGSHLRMDRRFADSAPHS
jgi:hypothetical protein